MSKFFFTFTNGILKSNKSYDCLYEQKQIASDGQQDKIARVVRHSMMDNQIDLLRTSYQTIVEKNNLLDEPYMTELLDCCKSVLACWNSKLFLSELRKEANSVRTIKRHAKASACNQKKSKKKAIVLRKGERKNSMLNNKEEKD